MNIKKCLNSNVDVNKTKNYLKELSGFIDCFIDKNREDSCLRIKFESFYVDYILTDKSYEAYNNEDENILLDPDTLNKIGMCISIHK